MHVPLPSTLGPEAAVQPSSNAAQERDSLSSVPKNDGVAGQPAGALPDSRIGALLQQAGKLSAENFERVIRLQQELGLRFGDAAMRLGLVNQEDIDTAIARQFAYPVAARSNSALSPQLVAAFHPASAQADTLRAIRSQLLLRWFGTGRHALAISGVGSGNASSVMAANLALVFAQLGQRTLLVDANMRHGVQHGLFGLHARTVSAASRPASPVSSRPADVRALPPSPGMSERSPSPGLSDLLAGRAGFDAVMPVPGFSTLSVLPSGTVPPNPQELLERSSFASLHEQLGELYDVVLYDVAPTSHGAEAMLVAAHAGAALLVAQKDLTPLAVLKRLTQQMTGAGVAVIGSVLVEA